MQNENQKIAVLIPCYNEEKTVEKVVNDFKKALPEADIYVYDNNSKDATYEKALKAGAIVRKEYRQGKGNVVRSMFRDVDADVYILVDGDDTYPAENAPEFISKVNEGFDMVVGDRLSKGIYTKENKRAFHDFGNNLVKFLVNKIFKANVQDIMSGYRAYSKRFVKNYPVLFGEFQIETDMTIFALHRLLNVYEIPIVYRDRPVGSVSKLNTYKDGFKVIMAILNLYRYYKPLKFFGKLFFVFLFLGLLIGVPVIFDYFRTGLVGRFPSAILASGLIIIAFILLVTGIILDSINHNDRETTELELRKNK